MSKISIYFSGFAAVFCFVGTIWMIATHNYWGAVVEWLLFMINIWLCKMNLKVYREIRNRL